MHNEDDVLEVQEVADQLRVNARTVLRLLEKGDLKAIKVGRQWRVRRSELERYLEGESPSASVLDTTATLTTLQVASAGRTASESATKSAVPRGPGLFSSRGRASQIETSAEEASKTATAFDEEITIKKQRLEMMNEALDTANKLVEMLHPDADDRTRAQHLQELLPRLLPSSINEDLASLLR